MEFPFGIGAFQLDLESVALLSVVLFGLLLILIVGLGGASAEGTKRRRRTIARYVRP